MMCDHFATWHAGEASGTCKPLEGAPSSQLQLVDIDSTRTVAVRTAEGIAVLGIGAEGIQTVIHVPGAAYLLVFHA